MFKRQSYSRRQAGFGLIEVLVAILVIAVGVLGVISMQVVAKRNLYEATQRSLATALARDVLERMRSNPGALADYEVAPMTSSSSISTGNTLATTDLTEIRQIMRGANEKIGTKDVGGLVEPRLCIEEDAGEVTVAIVWLGVAEMTNPTESDCGEDTSVFGADNKQRRLLVMSTFIQDI